MQKFRSIATGEVDWEANMADATKNSWKDEFARGVTRPVYISFYSIADSTRAGGVRGLGHTPELVSIPLVRGRVTPREQTHLSMSSSLRQPC